MREKIIDEYLRPLSIFGEKDGLVDIVDSEFDIASHMKREDAERLIMHDKKLMNFIYKVNELSPSTVVKILDGE